MKITEHLRATETFLEHWSTGVLKSQIYLAEEVDERILGRYVEAVKLKNDKFECKSTVKNNLCASVLIKCP